ncbi:hypothetical protein ACON3F_02400 [Providencia hangzhouensis]|uniref:Uncharacterized protein n=1 Tax=Providencia rettgeri TaxID=587 RepID=A0AAE3CVA3_PRORE|nr:MULTISPECIES: hypothetical protein [Providencia]QIF66560.1 hypothetical protein FVA72_14065 [Providencia sp. 1709051003]MBW3116188.1 hypothetical protein [Providencia rettgeri]MCK9791247.1 hypothetical protein [Providencia rettgeri]MDX7421932.1 hypothetical protein [Providencia sp. CIM-Carb-044]NHN51768.1 hypothetical protein [Providencia rettgeri]
MCINQLAMDLGLPMGDEYTQDWAYELPELYRTKEWLKKYIQAYSNDKYNTFEKNELMELMLDIVNDLLLQNSKKDDLIIKVLTLLSDNHQIHLQLIEHWSLDDESLENCFELTPAVREIRDSILIK